MRAVDEHQDLLRISVASAGNDHRLGAAEAPPAIVSMYLGDELTEILEAIERDEGYDSKEKELMRVGVHTLSKFPKDTTDRNRTSPFAFTGNKFEFRMLGSSASVSGANTVINTAVAEVLKQFADELEQATDFQTALHDLIKRVFTTHKRIIFNGNGYDDKWIAEAEKRGLLNLKTTPDALATYLDEKNIALYTSHKVYTEKEMRSRLEIFLEDYCKIIEIEARTMIDMAMKDILPAVSEYSQTLCNTALAKKKVSKKHDCSYENEMLARISTLQTIAYKHAKSLIYNLNTAMSVKDVEKRSAYFKDTVLPIMDGLRSSADELETIVPSKCWCFPTYGELLFGVSE